MESIMRERAAHAISYGERNDRPELVEAGRDVIELLSQGIGLDSVVRSEAYQTVMRVCVR